MLKITNFPKNHSCFLDLFKLFLKKNMHFPNKGISASFNPIRGPQNGFFIFFPLKFV